MPKPAGSGGGRRASAAAAAAAGTAAAAAALVGALVHKHVAARGQLEVEAGLQRGQALAVDRGLREVDLKSVPLVQGHNDLRYTHMMRGSRARGFESLLAGGRGSAGASLSRRRGKRAGAGGAAASWWRSGGRQATKLGSSKQLADSIAALSRRRTSFASCIASLYPRHSRGPAPNGPHAFWWRALSSALSSRNRSGRKARGSANWVGSRCRP
jgi:hypothetical protein